VPLVTYDTPDDLYVARGTPVDRFRPLYTGDVFADVRIPEVQDFGLAMVISQSCTMRGVGGRLVEKVLAVSVQAADPKPPSVWVDRYLKWMPLPDLIEREHHEAHFREMGQVKTDILRLENRIACLSAFGVNMLHQRLIFNLSRVEIRLDEIADYTAHNYEEADLQEEFTRTVCSAGIDEDRAQTAFEEFMSTSPVGEAGRSRRKDLRDKSLRPSVRRQCREEAERIARGVA